jgi:hypothetical protein
MNGREVKLERFQVEGEVKVAYDFNDGKNLAAAVAVNRTGVPKRLPIAD